ncbi:4'-phosphopantetheinyl transferase family protein [Bradyrhizobium sp. 2TAF24]|uniref:4'-phosphopantetheinyl transferase family protein n=1 Tax=Bradyrhizobium sp. 2TAF24 TaxID=3233011 RepID=UPI003F8ED75E
MPDVTVLMTAISSSDAAISRRRVDALQPDEQIRLERFRKQRDRALFVVGRSLLRYGLRELFGIPAAAIGAGPHGKPMLRDADADIDFNLAHSAHLVVAAFARGARVGIDVERLDGDSGVIEAASRHFAAEERKILTDVDTATLADCFLRIWTLKEAAVKATGLGLQTRLDGFAIALDPPRLVRAAPQFGDTSRWHFEERQWETARIALAVQQRHASRPDVSFRPVALSAL